MTDSAAPCPLCRSDDQAPALPVTEKHGVVLCRTCGIYHTHPFPVDTAAFYQEDYYSRHKAERFLPLLEWGIRWFRRERAWNVNRRYPVGRLLDVGCGRGLMIHILRERYGWQVQGTQVSRTAHEFATRTLKLPVFLGDLLEMPDEGPFTVVTLYHVLEHLSDPAADLRRVSTLLADGGACLIEVPNTRSWMAGLTRGRWFNWDPPYHTFHFEPDSLTRLVEKNGLRVESVDHWSGEFNTFSVLQSALNLIFRRRNYLFLLLQRKERIRKNPVPALACLALATLLAPAALAVALLGAAAGRGEVIRVYCRKSAG